MWLIVSTLNPDEKHPILGDKKYVVGRTGCDITINDPSVSRKQAVLMMAHYEANVVKSFMMPSLTLEDTSKFGTFVNGESVKKKPGCVMTLKDGDKIHFGGAPASIFIARYEPFVATTSCLEKIPKKNLQRVVCLLGGHVVRDWRATCDLLVMAKINVTIKVICAINNQKPIVTPDYLDHFHQFLMGQRDTKPDPKDYLPEVADKEVPAGVSFHPDIRRATLLKDLKFYFLSAHQFNKTNLAVSTAGGLPILLEDGTEEDADMMTQDGTIVVAVTRDVLTTLSTTCQKFVRTVCLMMKKKNLRMVTDPEIGWAILTCNTDDFCNPKSAITPSMYSSMASQSLSQMTDIDMDMSQHISNTQQQQHTSNIQDTFTHNQSASNIENTATPKQQQNSICIDMLPPGQPSKTVLRVGKRPANFAERDSEHLFHNKSMEDSISSIQSPVSKKIKQDPGVSLSQENLFSGTETETSKRGDNHSSHLYSASTFKSPQTPSVVESTSTGEKQSLDGANHNNGVESSSQLRLQEVRVKSNGSNTAMKPDEDDDDEDNSRNALLNFDEGVTDSSDNDNSSLFRNNNNKQSRNSNPLQNGNTAASSKTSGSSLSPGGFLSKNVVSSSLRKSSPPPTSSLSSSSKKGKKKKRALFCDSSDEDDSGVSASQFKKAKKVVVGAQNTSDDELNNSLSSSVCSRKDTESKVNAQNKDLSGDEDVVITETDFPSSSLICNGDTKVVVKQEVVSEMSSMHSRSNGSGDDSHPLKGSGSWAKVKKEEPSRSETIRDEELDDTNLVLDNNGRPLRHLCQVKVVDLIVKAPGSRHPGPEDNARETSQKQAGGKNFKRFKKTLHCGSSRLPTIIGGRDLEPHKATRLNHMDDLLEEAVTACTKRDNEDRDLDRIFNWREEDLAPKRKGKRK